MLEPFGKEEAPALSASEQLLERFRVHLAGERGLAEGTICNYVHAGRLLFGALERSGELDAGTLTVADVDGFVVAECRGGSIAAPETHSRTVSNELRGAVASSSRPVWRHISPRLAW